MPTVSQKDGVRVWRCDDWEEFNKFIAKRLDRKTVIWRGQRDSEWLLESSLSRLVKTIPKTEWIRVRSHKENFTFATRGRRGPNPRHIAENADSDWWALGQHHGLATPLLDWTSSPYAAVFFAYAKKESPKSKFRAVFGLSELPVKEKSKSIYDQWTGERKRLIRKLRIEEAEALNEPDTIECYRPMTDENPRLVNQSGLFTRFPLFTDIEAWVRKHFSGEKYVVLNKLLLPDDERETVLKALNRMNINYLSLFPDLEGASWHCNMQLSIDHY